MNELYGGHAREFVSAFRWLQQKHPDHPITTLANAGIADSEFMSASVYLHGRLRVFDAIADYLIWRFLRAEFKGRPDAQLLIEPVRAQLSASLAYCFNAFNRVVLDVVSSADLTSYELPGEFVASDLIGKLKPEFPLLSELLGYWFPLGNRQFYFFNSDFDYLSEYRVQPAG
ncbi:hypothetical protein [Xanthobacter wiegelii]|uniref:hypothetical protein n=1 Tax=Xanthobacter wiegelii TaxID=3119913 RepID=UPI0037287419